jgi:hypothetical protein
MNDKWIKDLRQLANQYRQTPPEGLLDDVKREMAARGLTPVAGKGSARIVPLWRRIAVAAGIAAILGVGTVGYLTYDGRSQQTASTGSGQGKTMVAAGNKASETVPETSPIATAAPSSFAKPRTWHRQGSVAERVMAAASDVKTALGLNAASNTEKEKEPLIAQADNTAAEPSVGESNRQANSAPTYRTETKSYRHAATPSFRSSHPSPWGVSMYYGGHPSTSPALNGNGYSGANGIMSDSPHAVYSAKLSKEDAARLAKADVPPIVHEEHHRPIKIGVSLEYRLNDRWSLQSGITYSRLTSDFTEESPSVTSTTKQKLHYIGIPLSLSYSVWQNPHVNVYVKAGGEIEKLVKGEATTQQTSETTIEPQTTVDVSEHRPVFSTHAAAGVEYRPGKVVSIFAEPGAELYFKNGSGIKSAYTDKTLNFNLNVGVRVNINRR